MANDDFSSCPTLSRLDSMFEDEIRPRFSNNLALSFDPLVDLEPLPERVEADIRSEYNPGAFSPLIKAAEPLLLPV